MCFTDHSGLKLPVKCRHNLCYAPQPFLSQWGDVDSGRSAWWNLNEDRLGGRDKGQATVVICRFLRRGSAVSMA
jgi:hypothetical protein